MRQGQNANLEIETSVGLVVGTLGTISQDDASRQLEKVLQSEVLRASPNLRRLLEYIGQRSLNGHGGELKEYTIGVEALDRQSDFDPKVDTIVRVQIHRLREKLARYYLQEGVEDELQIEIPRGQYCPVFLRPDVKNANPEIVEEELASSENLASSSVLLLGEGATRRTKLQVAATLFCLAAGLLGAFYLGKRSAPSASTIPRDPDVIKLWSSFLAEDKQPIIAYPDAVFLLDESNDLLRFRSGAINQRGSSVDHHLAEESASNPELVKEAGPLFYEDGYTGTGEIESAAHLAALFDSLGAHAQVKRSRDITIEDLTNHNVVLLGSSFQNKAVDEFPLQGDFHFIQAGLRHEIWSGSIVDLHPGKGEAAEYKTERDNQTQALRADYALVSLQPGLSPGRHIAILAGLDTTGTWGATEFATSKTGADLILTRSTSASYKGSPVLQIIVRCVLKGGSSVYSVSPMATHTVEWQEKP